MQTLSNKPKSIAQLFKDVWLHKHLIMLFVRRDLSIKYSQTFLKKAWMIVQPLGMMLVFSIFFGYILGWKSGNIPFPIYVFSGLIIWNLFNSGIQSASSVIIENSSLIKNNAFPEIIISISKMVVVSIDALISFFVLLVIMLLYKKIPSLYLVISILPIILTLLFSFSTVLIIQAISLKKRDILHIMPYALTVLIWVTPIFFIADLLPNNIRFVLYINPITSLIELWRSCILSEYLFNVNYMYSLFIIIPYFVIALFVYNKKQIHFNDHL